MMTSKTSCGYRPRVIEMIPDEVLPIRILIDSVLRSMLEQKGLDLHGIAEKLTSQGYRYSETQGELKLVWEMVGDDIFFLCQEGLGPPVMSTSVPLGSGRYDGHGIFVWDLVPQTVCAGAVGRRLGDVVSTGIRQLDDRTILEVRTCTENYSPPTAATRFLFAPDLIELGSRPALLSSKA